jgi:predicted HTH domain antitoxin
MNMLPLQKKMKFICNLFSISYDHELSNSGELLKNYKIGTFVKWIDVTFDSRRTGYNYLSYYDLYTCLPHNAKEGLKKISQKVAYLLASRDGGIDKKAEIINEHHNLKANELISLINEQIPSLKKTTSNNIQSPLNEFLKYLKKIQIQKDQFNEEDKELLQKINQLINHLIE